ncbi:MAG: ABC-2 family transporter protein, partial [Planctomycetales bacterium]|nr:ABC-2 family transporter protein [Planctomycetales bacterium]
MSEHPSYLGVFRTFLRNSLVREMTFRSNFIIQCISSVSWTLMNVGFYLLIFSVAPGIKDWDKYEFFVFLATTMFVNSIVQTFFMPNAQEFSELIRRGGLDFALLKPIDTQFLISLQRTEWSSMSNFLAGAILLGVSLYHLIGRETDPLQVTPLMVILYVFYILCGVAILYSLMISLSATSIWLGRNQTLYNFWFYITNFSRYPMEIYQGTYGTPLRLLFTFVVPVLVVVNVPARILAKPFSPETGIDWALAGFAVVATIGSLVASRWIFRRALL